jgi:tetratricopeptide (TPR) repeat protein
VPPSSTRDFVDQFVQRLHLPAEPPPLRLEPVGPWDPEEEYWGEPGDPLPEWTRDLIARGPRPALEMEQVLPGVDPRDMDDDPILHAAELSAAGRSAEARTLLNRLLRMDRRCLDAHAHLGNLAFPRQPRVAFSHYQEGVAIADRSLGTDFEGVLSWGWIDNRPFLRCLHGYGLCLWRLDRVEEAARVFGRMLWLNPSDNQGVRFLIDDIAAGRPWRPDLAR